MRFSWRTNRLPPPTPGVPQPSAFKQEWLVGDLFASVSIPSGQRLLVGVRNLADTEYQQPLGSLDEPGRSFGGDAVHELLSGAAPRPGVARRGRVQPEAAGAMEAPVVVFGPQFAARLGHARSRR